MAKQFPSKPLAQVSDGFTHLFRFTDHLLHTALGQVLGVGPWIKHTQSLESLGLPSRREDTKMRAFGMNERHSKWESLQKWGPYEFLPGPLLPFNQR